MRRYWMRVLVVALSLVMVSVSVAGAYEGRKGHRARQVADVGDFETGDTVSGKTVLKRHHYFVRGAVRGAYAPAGHVVTWWWVVFNNPDYCVDGCGEDDVDNAFEAAEKGTVDPVGVSIVYGNGRVVPWHGKLNMNAKLEVGYPWNREALVGHGLDDSKRAEIHVVWRSHGPVQKGKLHEQLTTFGGGCVDGPGDPCSDILFSVFLPPHVT